MHLGHGDASGGGGGTRVSVVRDVLDANDRIARENRAAFERAGVTVVNLMSAPGAGKTTLLERLVAEMRDVRLGVLEGDIHGTCDAERVRRHGIPVAQINTGAGFGGECHLDARMVRAGIAELPLPSIDLLMIENVGNLVCPAEFDVGQHARVMVASPTEGEEKPLKYPLMFRASDLVLVNKIDLLPHLRYDLVVFLDHLQAVHPGVPWIRTSAETGEGVAEWAKWLRELCSTYR